MNVKVEIQFASPTVQDMASMRSVALALTNDSKSVRVAARDGKPGWLVAEFTMPTESQSSAVGKIDGELRFWVSNREDSSIMFPKSEEERLRAKRKAERRRAARRTAREP
jgi:hypothetical protein